jgi:hypothetical protein
MKTTSLPGATKIDTPQGQAILETIRLAGDVGITRRGIASALGKRRLTQWDLSLLALMYNESRIEEFQKPRAGAIGFEMWYRIRDGA